MPTLRFRAIEDAFEWKERRIDKAKAILVNWKRMLCFDFYPYTTLLMRIFVSAFLAILFLQSGIDKVVDRRGNLEWLSEHFSRSPLAGFVPLLLATITVIEVAAGVLNAIGCILLILRGQPIVAFYGAVVAAMALTALFFGQRMAKDYVGAAVLVPYFLLALAAIYLQAP